MVSSLPRSTPAEQQVDPAAVLAFLDALEANAAIEMHSLMIVRHGHVVTEGWWTPYSASRPHMLYSLSKSFTSTAAGLAVAEGLFGLDDTVISHFSEFDADITDPRSRAMKVRHVASMASGHTQEMIGEAFGTDLQEPVRGFLLHPPERDPGTVFAYNQPCTYTLASIISRTSGMRLTEYLRPRLFDPLGIGEVGWQEMPAGRQLGFSGLHARTEDIAKLGQLYLQRGEWNGSQLLSPEWVEQATSKQVENPNEPNPDWRQGYGFQFWMSRHGYRGDGAFGQFCVVLPEHDMVVATTASTGEMQAMLDALWTHVLPGLGATESAAGAETQPDAQQQLEARLSGLELPACWANPAPSDWASWTDKPFIAATAEADDQRSSLTAVAVERTGDAWQVAVHEADNQLTFPVGTGIWTVSTPADRRGDPVPVAASGGWVDDQTLRIELIFLETPHRMDITCTVPDQSARIVWRNTPMGQGKIEELHSPH